MNLYPAIDIYEGQVVRLTKGDFQQKTVYSENPADIARDWERQGAKWIHVVDLEGAKTGTVANLKSVCEIRDAVSCRIQMGGGMRKAETIDSVLKAGIDRVVIGTKALDENFLKNVLERFGPQIAVGLDTRDGRVQTQGWLESEGLTVDAAISMLNETPLETLIYTDIQKDGMLQGPDFEGLRAILDSAKANVILSGGIGGLKDIERCAMIKHSNFEGTIIGKALYENKFTLTDAFNAVRGG